jgi:hypothetical protein
MKFASSKVNGATNHFGRTLSLFFGALKCIIHNIISMELVSLKSLNCYVIQLITHSIEEENIKNPILLTTISANS